MIGITEIDDCIKRYGSQLIEKPKYVICGCIYLNNKWHGGILIYVKHEFWGKIICQVAKKYGGNYTVERTEFHEDGESYFDRCAEIFDYIMLRTYGYVIVTIIR